ncbi:lantibiotic dehydratase [Elizabethkingia anophelis]|uniref:lantibiotic dehydratase family protein n=1 Tax=Weeksellaceae TaxID=2762318 RepID=UPI000CE971E4|nr:MULTISPECIES: lantibiotic dehydratase family protein [Weeksellaceae]AVF49565.1 lantibiotic dehydratase [Elizabethkingia anophelis]AVF50187.1 lantibiotic dehydratase [Elizabethkingia anophelis]MDV4035721.1 lantibiotic dehydratase [Elizabethkingia anophelis]
MPQFPYLFFEEYVFRTPMFSYKKIQKIFDKEEVSDKELEEICKDPVFLEAIYLASPDFYGITIEWLSGKKLSTKQYGKLRNTLLKYYVRMGTRCTPFGLFSMIGLGKFGENNIESLSSKSNRIEGLQKNIPLSYVRETKLDMHFLVALSRHFLKIPEIRDNLLFYPNNSIYQIGNKIRYIEYECNNGKKSYSISSAPLSEELKLILEASKNGENMQSLIKSLVNSEITEYDAREYIQELIENQLLISEIEPNVSGRDFLDTLISIFKRIEAKEQISVLTSIKLELEKLDQQFGNGISMYSKIEELIKKFKIGYEKQYLFQTDLYSNSEHILPLHLKKELRKGISFLNKIVSPQKDIDFEQFKKAFRDRFEDQEVSLLYALDIELGIGYKQNVHIKGIHPYIEDLDIPSKVIHNIKISDFHKILIDKLQESLLENQLVIELFDEDFKDFNESWNDLPDTMSFVGEIVSTDKGKQLLLNGSHGSSAANLLGRFCSEKSKVHTLTRAITHVEEDLNSEYILAEIIHLPDDRIGNIIRRPTLRKYEIPYLAQSIVAPEYKVNIDDLYISLRNEKIIIRSKKLNKEIKPYLTNAHNYYTNTLPVYHFLSDLQSQNLRTELHFDWGDLQQFYNFFPRVEYKNIIISKARWKISEKEIIRFSLLRDNEDDREQILSNFKIWRDKRSIPQWIQWAQADNKLTLNLQNYDMVKIFIDIIKKHKSVIVEEFLCNNNDDFIRQFVFPIYKTYK